MARFFKMDDDVYINLDTIVSMQYDKEDNKTRIFSCDDPSEHFICEGNVIDKIINASNELTMKDKLFANYIFNKFKVSVSQIQNRVDQIYRKA